MIYIVIAVIAAGMGTGLIPYLCSSLLIKFFSWQPPKPPEHDPEAMPYRSLPPEISMVKPWRMRWHERSEAHWKRWWRWLRDNGMRMATTIAVGSCIVSMAYILYEKKHLDSIPQEATLRVEYKLWGCTFFLLNLFKFQQTLEDVVEWRTLYGAGDQMVCPEKKVLPEPTAEQYLTKRVDFEVTMRVVPDQGLSVTQWTGRVLTYKPGTQLEFHRFKPGQVWSVRTYRTGRVDWETLRRIDPPEHDPLSTPHP